MLLLSFCFFDGLTSDCWASVPLGLSSLSFRLARHADEGRAYSPDSLTGVEWGNVRSDT